MNTETHKERAEKIISMLVWLDGLPLHRRASLRDMIEAGMMEAVAYERERNENNVAGADHEVGQLKEELRKKDLQIDELRKALRGILQYGTRTVDDDDETPMGVQIEGCHVQSLRLEKDWRAAIEVAFPEKPCQELNFRTEPCTLKAGHCGSHVFADKRKEPS